MNGSTAAIIETPEVAGAETFLDAAAADHLDDAGDAEGEIGRAHV